MNALRIFCLGFCAAVLVVGSVGCGDKTVDDALTSDANGYLCKKCSAKFYLDRKFFPNRCPECKTPNYELVLGFVCPVDKHVTYAGKGRGSHACEQCGKVTSAILIPRAADLKAWGATKKTAAEVLGN
ncbi:MAG: hypothetical protein EXS35_04940 [Pedosphaera sp.]|nr:hypothetical protein [Pedosphaera sp.]